MRASLLCILASAGCVSAFVGQVHPFQQRQHHQQSVSLFASSSSPDDPQVIASGYSTDENLNDAILEATELAIESLPPAVAAISQIDLAVIFVSSLYDSTFSPSGIVPSLLSAASSYGNGIQHVLGSTAGGVVGSVASNNNNNNSEGPSCRAVELEGTLGVSVSLMLLPDVELKTFHVLADDVPDDLEKVTKSEWKEAVGLQGVVDGDDDTAETPADEAPIFMVLPSPAFQNDLDDLLEGLQHNFPHSKTFGALASTVSSLSRARLFRYDAQDPKGMQTMGNGCVGLAMTGDIDVRNMIAQGGKPVGGIYQVVQSKGSTINAIVLDETASDLERASRETEGDDEADDDDEEEEEEENAADIGDKKAQMKAAYAKAIIPKPILAEANFLMKSLSDDDQEFMRKVILVGLERGGSMGRAPSELARLRAGQGHRFDVQQVASANMKDGSVTLPLDGFNIESGTRMRFFVRDAGFAKKEVKALWAGYKKGLETESEKSKPAFQPTGCFLMPTLDRGSKFFKGKAAFESRSVTTYIPDITSVSGFFSNGVIMKLNENDATETSASAHGSASGYVVFGSKSGRPRFSPAAAAATVAKETEDKEAVEQAFTKEDAGSENQAKTVTASDEKAPRSEDGELILKRREIHSGRAMTVSTVEWSVAERTATPSSTLEGFMWDKETEVDRFRERVPLANLVSQCRLGVADPTKPKPRDWIGVVKQASKDGFVIIPECKRMEPGSGSLWKRYDAEKLAEKFTMSGAPAFSVNCDAVLFGGSQEDITTVRKAASDAALEKSPSDDGVVAPPVLASDLILYPYQLYKLSLAGADAVNLVGGSLATKDLLYLTKIAASLKLQTLITVTSEVQLRALAEMSPGGVDGVIISNRELEDFSFDMTGEQALRLLKSDAIKAVRETHGEDTPLLVEGRVGVIERPDSSGKNPSIGRYLEELRDAGAMGVIIGGGLAEGNGYASLQEMAKEL